MKVYDPDQITVVFAGILMRGFTDGEFVRIGNRTEDFTLKIGTDGIGTRSKTNDRSGVCSIFLEQTSEVNALLSALRNSDLNTPGGAGVGALLVRDRLSGTTLYRSAASFIEKNPDSSFDRESSSREWVILCEKLESFIGGN